MGKVRLSIAPIVLAAALWGESTAVAGVFKPAPKNGVPDVYIVVLRDGVARTPGGQRPDLPAAAQVAQALGRAHGGEVTEVWEHALRGFVIRMPEARARKLAEDPRVESVEQNLWISAPVGDCYLGTAWQDTRTLPSSTSSPQTLDCTDPDPLNDTGGPTVPPACKDNWGIDRVDQTSFARNNLYSFPNSGSNVHVYVMDTGIRWTHREFLNASGVTRVSGGVDARTNPVTAGNSTNTTDCYGHGTHVAGIIAGRTFGVAKNALLHPVRIIGCPQDFLTNQEFADNVIRGLNWITGEVTSKRSTFGSWPSVINWSGGNDSTFVTTNAVRTAVENVVDNDVILVQAAGNQSPDWNPSSPSQLRDACDWSFGGSVPKVIVAAGVDHNDARWTRRPTLDPDDDEYCPPDCGSNAGSCVDIWSPSAHVIASNNGANDLACRLSGTSMAAPHVSGAIAVYLANNPTATVDQVERALRSRGTWGALQTSASNANFIGYDSDNVLLLSSTTTTGDTAPVGSFTFSCEGRLCNFNASASTDDAGISSYTWRFPNGTTTTGVTTQYIFPANDIHFVVLKVTDGTGKTDHVRESVEADAVLTAPTSTAALAAGSTVTITWTPSSGATSYDLYRKISAAGWALVKNVSGGSSSSTTDVPPSSSNGVVLYHVTARGSGGSYSPPSNFDVAYVGSFTDDPVATTAPLTSVKAEHITEVRNAVNGLRDLAGQSAVYSASEVDPNNLRSQVIDDAHFATLLTNLNNARGAFALSSVSFRTPAPAGGVTIARTHIEDLRLAVK